MAAISTLGCFIATPGCRAHAAHADERDRNAVVRAFHGAGENLSGERGARVFQEVSALGHDYPFATMFTSLSGITMIFTICFPCRNC